MSKLLPISIVAAAVLAGPLTIPPLAAAASELPNAIVVSGETLVTTVQAAGTQIYECKADSSGKLGWQLREPVATLFADGKTVGRHYAGPYWEMADGSTVSAKPTGRAPGASEDDIPLLRLEVTSWRGTGQLANVTSIQRINTRGGVAEGACDSAGTLQSVPYTADYAFYRRPDLNSGTAAPVTARPVAAAAPRYAPAVLAEPPQVPAIHMIILPRDILPRRKKKRDERPNKPGEPNTPPTAEPKGPTTPTPTPPAAEPKSPPTGPKSTDTNRPKYVRDHRKDPPYVVTDDRKTPEPKVRDHRGVDREPPKPRTAEGDPKVRDHRGVDPETRQGQSPQRAPKVRDYRGVDRDPPKPRNSASGSIGGGSLPCGASGLPPCRTQ